MKPVNATPSTPSRRRAVLRAALVLSCAVALAGCGTIRGWFSGGDDETSATDPRPLQDFTARVEVNRIWNTSVGKGERRIGARQGPAVANGRVYAAGVSHGVRAPDLRLAGTPGVGDGLVVVGGLEGDVLALDADTGAERWSAKVGNEVLAAPAIGQGMVVVRSNDGRVTAFDAASGEQRWFWVQEL